ncbi:hypothetical protein AAT19DRAFT_10986 [Rhodotorula toruloides]|uniref:Uncharacterized protein n=1 Tax=Rhodotorula toruloides TaxID=5286 RepID=A0A2S9ZYH3_RHOTO|nr:hypothetical protein AAT19DRAFT_10986 [Rhodotorula toruloides]
MGQLASLGWLAPLSLVALRLLTRPRSMPRSAAHDSASDEEARSANPLPPSRSSFSQSVPLEAPAASRYDASGHGDSSSDLSDDSEDDLVNKEAGEGDRYSRLQRASSGGRQKGEQVMRSVGKGLLNNVTLHGLHSDEVSASSFLAFRSSVGSMLTTVLFGSRLRRTQIRRTSPTSKPRPPRTAKSAVPGGRRFRRRTKSSSSAPSPSASSSRRSGSSLASSLRGVRRRGAKSRRRIQEVSSRRTSSGSQRRARRHRLTSASTTLTASHLATLRRARRTTSVDRFSLSPRLSRLRARRLRTISHPPSTRASLNCKPCSTTTMTGKGTSRRLRPSSSRLSRKDSIRSLPTSAAPTRACRRASSPRSLARSSLCVPRSPPASYCALMESHACLPDAKRR